MEEHYAKFLPRIIPLTSLKLCQDWIFIYIFLTFLHIVYLEVHTWKHSIYEYKKTVLSSNTINWVTYSGKICNKTWHYWYNGMQSHYHAVE